MSPLAFLHTAVTNRSAIAARLGRSGIRGHVMHLVDEALLAGPWASPADRDDGVAAAIGRLGRRGAARVICTCSTIGASAEAAGARLGIPTTRVDRPLMQAAAARGGDVAVVVAAPTTRSTTLALLHDERTRLGVRGQVTPIDMPDAWANFVAGRYDLYREQIATAAREALADHDTVVLAQLSMAPAAAGLGPNVLTSLECMLGDVREFFDGDAAGGRSRMRA